LKRTGILKRRLIRKQGEGYLPLGNGLKSATTKKINRESTGKGEKTRHQKSLGGRNRASLYQGTTHQTEKKDGVTPTPKGDTKRGAGS